MLSKAYPIPMCWPAARF